MNGELDIRAIADQRSVLENEIGRIWRHLTCQYADLIPADLLPFVGVVFHWYRAADGDMSNLGSCLWDADRKSRRGQRHSVWVSPTIFGEGAVADLPDLRAKCAQLVQAWENRILIEVDTQKRGVRSADYVVLQITLPEVFVSSPTEP